MDDDPAEIWRNEPRAPQGSAVAYVIVIAGVLAGVTLAVWVLVW